MKRSIVPSSGISCRTCRMLRISSRGCPSINLPFRWFDDPARPSDLVNGIKSDDEFNAWQETAYLLSNRANSEVLYA